jgi:maleylpyruvate isomerase
VATREPVPESVDELRAATGRLLDDAQGWAEGAAALPSLLPGWSRGHVLTHLARNADGIRNLVTWATTGVETPMYPSMEARAAAIEAGAARPLPELLTDLRDSAARLDVAWADLDGPAEDVVVRMGRARTPTPGWCLPLHRTREVQIHHVDLGSGFGPQAWPDRFVRRTLDQLAPTFRERGDSPVRVLRDPDGASWELAEQGPAVQGPAAHLLAWLVGRSPGADLVVDGGGPVPAAPEWS